MLSVSTDSQLSKIGTCTSVKLESDIRVSEQFDPIPFFNGIFDGNGYTIYGLQDTFIKQLKSESVVKDISFENCDIQSDKNEKSIINVNKGLLENISVASSRISGKKFVGGLIGKNNWKCLKLVDLSVIIKV